MGPIENGILEKVKPTEEEQEAIDRTVGSLLEVLKEMVSEEGLDVRPVLVGSVAKGTHLKNPDLDVFLTFPTDAPIETLRDITLKVGGRVLENPEKRYAQHPYLRGTYNGMEAEIVPCYRVEKASAKMSAVDRTPFHTDYVKENFDPDLRDNTRLFKAFLKGTGLYGAEIAVRGFSGYLCELLILKYGDFRNTLAAASEWRRPVRVRLDEGTFPEFKDPLVFIDPVDPTRNVAAPISHHSFSLFIKASRDYLANPGKTFFFPNPLEILEPEEVLDEAGSRGTGLIGIVIPIPHVVEDIYASQVDKAERATSALLERGGFPLTKSQSFIVDRPNEDSRGEALIILEVGLLSLSSIKLHRGPEVGHPNEDKFVNKWKDHPSSISRPHIEKRRWVVLKKRKYRTPEELILSKLGELNLGKHLNEEIGSGGKVIGIEELASEYNVQMTEFLDSRFPWER